LPRHLDKEAYMLRPELTAGRQSLARLIVIVPLALAVSLSGCATSKLTPRFEDSNQMLLEETVGILDVGGKVSKVIPDESKIAVVSLEKPETLDHPVLALIEDQLVASLLEDGYTVLERDFDSLIRLASEKSAEHFRIIMVPSDVRVSSAGAAAGYGTYGLLSSGYLSGAAGVTEISGLKSAKIETLNTRLEPADYIISYRVLECGIVYRDASKGRKEREAMVRLHVRVQDTATSEILFSENVMGTLEDQVDEKLVDDLEDFRYSFYAHDLPMERGTPRGRREIKGSEEKSGAETSLGWLAFGGIGALIYILAATSK
jgi:hypothetical protein